MRFSCFTRESFEIHLWKEFRSLPVQCTIVYPVAGMTSMSSQDWVSSDKDYWHSFPTLEQCRNSLEIWELIYIKYICYSGNVSINCTIFTISKNLWWWKLVHEGWSNIWLYYTGRRKPQSGQVSWWHKLPSETSLSPSYLMIVWQLFKLFILFVLIYTLSSLNLTMPVGWAVFLLLMMFR